MTLFVYGIKILISKYTYLTVTPKRYNTIREVNMVCFGYKD